MKENALYYGDNLYILREHIQDESIDLVYLDPPFGSNRSYNVLFEEENGAASAAQVQVFEDTWHWNQASEEAFADITENAPPRLVELIKSFLSFLGRNQFTAYLMMMAPRLLELHRVLKSTGSIYLHCDPTASHYLKLILDQIFGVKNFRNEIVWCYKGGGRSRKDFSKRHDTIFRYSKSDNYVFNSDDIRIPYEASGINRKDDSMWGRHRGTSKIYKPHPLGKVPEDWWPMNILNANDPERLGYPSQKPEALLERIIKASSNEGDVVLDPFCGCGTAIAVAERLKRRWIGIDITHLAIALMKHRFEDAFGSKISNKYEVIGEPKDVSGARALAQQDRYQFQWWVLSLVGARPIDQKKKGADQGVDGVRYINITPGRKKPTTVKVIVQVKSGHVSVKDIREFKAVIGNAKAEMGVFLTLNDPTRPMKKEALSAGYYKPSGIIGAIQCPKIQILTIEELLNGKRIQYPMHEDMTFRRADRVEEENQEDHPELLL